MISKAPISLLTNGICLDRNVIAKEDDRIFKMPIWLFEILVSVLAFVVIFVSYIIIKPIPAVNGLLKGSIAKGYGFTLLAFILVYFLYLLVNHKLTYRRLVVILMMVGFVLRLTYMLYSPASTRQHDTFSVNHDAHYDYAYAFYSTGTLPDHHIAENNIYQFYHPPFNAFIQGLWMKIFEAINSNAALETTETVNNAEILTSYYSCTILSCFYMYITSLFFVKAINQTKFSNGSKLLAIAFISLFPRLIQLSTLLNNDALSVMFSAIALYYYMRWYTGKKSWIDMCLTGLFMGLALMSKMSASTIALGMAIGYLIQLIHSIRKEENALPIKTLLLQYVVFLVIAAPIGLWWQLYTHFVYGLPFNFVFSRLNSALYVGSRDWVLINKPESINYYDSKNMEMGALYTSQPYNIFIRYILPVYFPDFKNIIFCSATSNYNFLSYALRCAMFGEFSNWGTSSAQGIAVLCTVAIYIVWFNVWANLIYILVRRKKFGSDGMMAFHLLMGMIIMFFYLQITMPYGCSMDFRYVVPIILPIAYLIAKENDILKDTVKENRSKVAFTLKQILNYSTIVFLTSTSIFYLSAN